MNNLAEFLQDTQGGLSMTRLFFALWNIDLIFLITYLTLKGGSFPTLPEYVLIILGTIWTGKVIQRQLEKEPTTS